METNEMFRAAMLLAVGIGTIGGVFITLAGMEVARRYHMKKIPLKQKVEERKALELAQRTIRANALMEVNELLNRKENEE